MQLILFVLSQPEKLKDLLDAWETAGASGVTILASTGLGKLRQNALLREDLPLIPALDDLFSHEEISSRTLITVVNEDSLVDKLLEMTRQVVGNLERPNSGIFIVLPVSRVYGLKKKE
jgi:nitrogen regulatory protein P-II 1